MTLEPAPGSILTSGSAKPGPDTTRCEKMEAVRLANLLERMERGATVAAYDESYDDDEEEFSPRAERELELSHLEFSCPNYGLTAGF